MNSEPQGFLWQYSRIRRAFEELDKEEIADSVYLLRVEFPGQSELALAKKVIRKYAAMSAAMGVVSAGPSILPGLGTVLSLATILPEEQYLAIRRCKMVLKIAAIYGFDPRSAERLDEIMALIGIPSRTLDMLMSAKEDLRHLAVRASSLLTRVSVKESKVGLRAVARGAGRRLPLLGFLAGGAINFMSLKNLGKQATRFYHQKRYGPTV